VCVIPGEPESSQMRLPVCRARLGLLQSHQPDQGKKNGGLLYFYFEFYFIMPAITLIELYKSKSQK
jgi:hypothetical protein